MHRQACLAAQQACRLRVHLSKQGHALLLSYAPFGSPEVLHALHRCNKRHGKQFHGNVEVHTWSTSSSSTSPCPSSGLPLALRRAASRIMPLLESSTLGQ